MSKCKMHDNLEAEFCESCLRWIMQELFDERLAYYLERLRE